MWPLNKISEYSKSQLMHKKEIQRHKNLNLIISNTYINILFYKINKLINNLNRLTFS